MLNKPILLLHFRILKKIKNFFLNGKNGAKIGVKRSYFKIKLECYLFMNIFLGNFYNLKD